MGGFLESLGRTNALSNAGQTIFQNAVNIRKMQTDEAQAGFANAINLERLNMAKATDEREATKFEWAAKDQAAKDAALDMPVPVTKYLGVGWENDPAKKMMFDKAKELGIVKESAGIPYTTQRHLPTFTNYAKEDLAWTKQLNEVNLQKMNSQLVQIGTVLQEEKNPKKVEELTAQKNAIEGQISGLIKHSIDIDVEHQKKKDLEKTNAEGRIEGIQIGAEGRSEAARTAADARVDAAKIAADARVEAANARAEAAKAREGAGESKEEKRLVKARTEVRREVEKAFGFSQWLPTATDPLLLKKVGIGKEIAEDIIDNYKQYGLNKEPTPGKAAQMAKIKVEDQLSKKPPAAPVEDKKTKSIRELLFGSSEKK